VESINEAASAADALRAELDNALMPSLRTDVQVYALADSRQSM
jgi:hypothetical protein